MKQRTKRTLTIGDKEHLVSRVVEVDIPKRALYIEELADGTLRVTYSKALVPDVALLERLVIGPA